MRRLGTVPTSSALVRRNIVIRASALSPTLDLSTSGKTFPLPVESDAFDSSSGDGCYSRPLSLARYLRHVTSFGPRFWTNTSRQRRSGSEYAEPGNEVNRLLSHFCDVWSPMDCRSLPCCGCDCSRSLENWNSCVF
jgi:hypothetical protein